MAVDGWVFVAEGETRVGPAEDRIRARDTEEVELELELELAAGCRLGRKLFRGVRRRWEARH